jgi:hypothetical protein
MFDDASGGVAFVIVSVPHPPEHQTGLAENEDG